TLAACQKGGGGDAAAGTPNGTLYTAAVACNTRNYYWGPCSATSDLRLPSPGNMTWGPWTFPGQWDVNTPGTQCGCPVLTWNNQVIYQRVVIFQSEGVMACAPETYFRLGFPAVPVASLGGKVTIGFPGVQAGVNTLAPMPQPNYMNLQTQMALPAYQYSPQINSIYSPDPKTQACINNAVIGCNTSLENMLNSNSQSQCNGGYCIPISNEPGKTVGFCSYRSNAGNPWDPASNQMLGAPANAGTNFTGYYRYPYSMSAVPGLTYFPGTGAGGYFGIRVGY
ncbi:MAG: hypothetical protein C5B49_05400, partial [Bdellovibrio sp.]